MIPPSLWLWPLAHLLLISWGQGHWQDGEEQYLHHGARRQCHVHSIGFCIFPIPEVPVTQGQKRRVRVARVQADAGWTKRMKRGTTAAPSTAHPPNSVHPDDATTLWGLECLPADLCRALGRVSTRPSALSNVVLRRPGGQDAGVWQPGQDGLCRVPLPAVWPGHPSGGNELQIVVVLAVCQSLRGHLGEPGEHGPARGCDLSAPHPHGPGDVSHDLLPERRGVGERVDAMRGAVPGRFL